MSDLPSIYAVILTIVLVICLIVTGAPIQTEYGDEIRLPSLFNNKTSTAKNSTSLKANDFDNDFSTPEGKKAALALLHRSDTFPSHTSGGTFFGDPRLRMQWVVWISVRSWVAYKTFATDTCRFVADQLPDFSDDNFFYNNDYFRYEESIFNLKLRNLLFPETSRGDLKSMLGTSYLTKLDARFFQMPLKSLCSMSPDDKKKAGETTEASRFEDKVINKVASKDNRVIPSLSERFDRFQAWIASESSHPIHQTMEPSPSFTTSLLSTILTRGNNNTSGCLAPHFEDGIDRNQFLITDLHQTFIWLTHLHESPVVA